MKRTVEKSDNRKALPKFLLMILVSLIAGGLIGVFIGLVGETGLLETASAGLDSVLAAVIPWGIPVTSVLSLGASLALYRSARRRFEGWDGEDEDAADHAERLLDWVLLLNCLQLVVNLFFFAAAVPYGAIVRLPVIAGAFVLSSALLIVVQQKVVDLTKQINPEKQGSVYEVKFRKRWLESCDEAEQRQIGQAAFRAYTVTSRACLWIWLALVVLNMLFDIGLMPVFVVMLLWGIMQAVYILECIKLSKRGGMRDAR